MNPLQKNKVDINVGPTAAPLMTSPHLFSY